MKIVLSLSVTVRATDAGGEITVTSLEDNTPADAVAVVSPVRIKNLSKDVHFEFHFFLLTNSC